MGADSKGVFRRPGLRRRRPEHYAQAARFHFLSLKTAMEALCGLLTALPAFAGGREGEHAFKVIAPIVHGNLAIYPVLTNASHDTSQFLTLDEGIGGGQVIVTEAGNQRGLVRPGQPIAPRQGNPEVNRLVLFNNSSRPLLLLAGEIVSGGKQDRVVGSDRIVPPGSGPIDLGVFCVEPGRWTGPSPKFSSMGVPMAQPSVRIPAMAQGDQDQVWEKVRSSNALIAEKLNAVEAQAIGGTTSYAKVFTSPGVGKQVAEYGGTESEQSILRQLRASNAVGVVVAIDGRLMWADVFASTDLLARYWHKLMLSYVAEALTSAGSSVGTDLQSAAAFINNLDGSREVVETQTDVFRRADVTGDGYRVFELTSLLPKAGFRVHVTKLTQ